jgi:hypothetical protein
MQLIRITIATGRGEAQLAGESIDDGGNSATPESTLDVFRDDSDVMAHEDSPIE